MSARLRATLLSAAILSGLSVHSPAQAEPKYLSYYLPKAQIGAAVSQRLVRCPKTNEPVSMMLVETSWALKSRAVPDYEKPVVINAAGGFLTARNVGMKFNNDGTLTSINAKSEGQGGAVLTSAIKLAGMVAPLLVGLPPPPLPAATDSEAAVAPESRCKKEIVDLLDRHADLEVAIAETELAIRNGQSGPEIEGMLARYRQQLLAVEEDLTLSGTAEGLNGQVSSLQPCQADKTCKPEGQVVIKRLDYGQWLASATDVSAMTDFKHGFVVLWAGSSAAATSLAAASGQWVPPTDPAKPKLRDLIYLRPVPAILVAGPCKNAACELDESDAAAKASDALEFALPQLSPRFALPIGGAGIFGSREVAASFDALGRPTELSFGSDPGAAAIAGAIDAVGETATKIHTAELDAMTHAIAMEEARDKLASLTE
jgi:hypothetical protein